MTAKNTPDGYIPRMQDYSTLPETPPAHIWAFKALRNQFLGTRPSPLVAGDSFGDEIDEISLPPQESPSSPSKAGILKTPGTISRRKSVTFNNKSSAAESSSDKQAKDTPKEKRTSILSRNFPGKYPSPFTPRTRQSTPEILKTHVDGDTDLIAVSRSVMQNLTAHLEFVLENNVRLQEIIAAGEVTYSPFSKYSGHPDLLAMKQELEREKDVLKGLFADFEQQQAKMSRQEKELNSQYTMLRQQMEEQYSLQSSTAKIVEDYSHKIQELNQTVDRQREASKRDLDEAQARADGFEQKMHALEAELDDAKDILRAHHEEIDSRDFLIADLQEKLRRTQRQLSQLRMETLEARVGPNTQSTEGENSNRPGHRRTTSRRAVSATYGPITVADTKISESPQQKSNALISYRPTDEMEMEAAINVLSPRSTNIEETATQSRVPGQDAVARRAAAAKRLEERQRNRERLGKENSCL